MNRANFKVLISDWNLLPMKIKGSTLFAALIVCPSQNLIKSIHTTVMPIKKGSFIKNQDFYYEIHIFLKNNIYIAQGKKYLIILTKL